MGLEPTGTLRWDSNPQVPSGGTRTHRYPQVGLEPTGTLRWDSNPQAPSGGTRTHRYPQVGLEPTGTLRWDSNLQVPSGGTLTHNSVHTVQTLYQLSHRGSSAGQAESLKALQGQRRLSPDEQGNSIQLLQTLPFHWSVVGL